MVEEVGVTKTLFEGLETISLHLSLHELDLTHTLQLLVNRRVIVMGYLTFTLQEFHWWAKSLLLFFI